MSSPVDSDDSDDTARKHARIPWLPLESNPAMLNEFVHRVGCDESWNFIDVLGTDPMLLSMVPEPVAAVTLLFPCGEVDRPPVQPDASNQAGLFYMTQFTPNACGTIAAVHAVANSQIPVSGALADFKDANAGQSPDTIGLALGQAQALHQVSEAAAVNEQTTTESSIAQAVSGNVACHFICFVERDGKLWELDGCRDGPVCHGEVGPSLLRKAAHVIETEFLQNSDSYEFNMMALVGGSGILNGQTPRNSAGGYPLQRSHSGICNDLLAMGFAAESVEFAVAASGGSSVQAAMDLLTTM